MYLLLSRTSKGNWIVFDSGPKSEHNFNKKILLRFWKTRGNYLDDEQFNVKDDMPIPMVGIKLSKGENIFSLSLSWIFQRNKDFKINNDDCSVIASEKIAGSSCCVF